MHTVILTTDPPLVLMDVNVGLESGTPAPLTVTDKYLSLSPAFMAVPLLPCGSNVNISAITDKITIYVLALTACEEQRALHLLNFKLT